ncbi:MAG: glycine--tRNA ligase subunit beta [Sphingomonas sp.]|nr:MAG: glycine--tRNA ligase subunit beta [Sphingomonas sp.]
MASATVAVSLADKLDTLFSFFAADERPTGSKDPFALRRAALAILATQLQLQLRWEVSGLYDNWIRLSGREYLDPIAGLEHLRYFFADRLKVQQREAGVRHDLIDAVFALGGEDDLVRLLARVRALQAFVGTPDGTNLLAGYKRAANILKKEGYALSSAPANAGAQGQVAIADPGLLPVQEHGTRDARLSYTPEPAEAALIAALDSAEPAAAAAIAAEDFERAMAALASLRAPIDAFFDTVTVNDPAPEKRSARLDLLARIRTAVHAVADFSRIEG